MEQINELMNGYLQLQKDAKSITEKMDEKKERIKLLMNENDMTFYENAGNTINKIPQKRETLNKARVKELLTEEQFKSAIKVTEFESLRIMSLENKERQLKHLKEKKN